ncbi:hypothetical protein RYX36_025753 [Vicia faba]
MASAHQISQVSQIIPGSSSTIEERNVEPSRTLLTPVDSLEVLCELIFDLVSMKDNGLIEYLTEAQQANVLKPCARKPLNAKKMKIIETVMKDPTITTKEVITTRRVPLKDFPLFTQADSSPEIVLRYLETCKSDGTIPDVNILDLRK